MSCTHLTCNKVMLKILQARFQQFVNQELPEVQTGFWRGARDKIVNILWSIEKARELQKNIYFCFSDSAKAFDCVDYKKLENSLKNWEYQTTLPVSPEKPVYMLRSNS